MTELNRFIRAGYDGNVDFKFGKLTISNYNCKFTFNSNLLEEIKQNGVTNKLVTS
jgi:hypothetical protein